ncbi:MAG: hypothetical protein Q9203_000642, partial [Teloschistes exilis]
QMQELPSAALEDGRGGLFLALVIFHTDASVCRSLKDFQTGFGMRDPECSIFLIVPQEFGGYELGDVGVAHKAGVEEWGGGFEDDGFVLYQIRSRGGLGREGFSLGRRGGMGDGGDVYE